MPLSDLLPVIRVAVVLWLRFCSSAKYLTEAVGFDRLAAIAPLADAADQADYANIAAA